MKYPPVLLTPFLAALPQALRVFPPHASPIPTAALLHALPTTHRPLPTFCFPVFSRTYELPPPHHRFASHAFSYTYELLFSQLTCFQKHLRCPLVFRSKSRFLSPRPGAQTTCGRKNRVAAFGMTLGRWQGFMSDLKVRPLKEKRGAYWKTSLATVMALIALGQPE